MGLYVEVMCDEQREGADPRNPLEHFCWSDRNDNPQGVSRQTARAEARRQGWKLGRGNQALCPNCATPDEQRASMEQGS